MVRSRSARSKSKPPGSPSLRFRIVALEPQVRFATKVRFPGAGLALEHAIEPLATGARITHRVTLSGPLRRSTSGEDVHRARDDSPRMISDIKACTPIVSLAQCRSGMTSVGLNAVAFVRPR